MQVLGVTGVLSLANPEEHWVGPRQYLQEGRQN